MLRDAWCRVLACALVPLFVCTTGGAAAKPLEVPILVEPLTPEGAPNYTPGPGVVAVGVPFAPEAGLRDVDSLGLQGSSAAQFRILERDPNNGAVTWVLATFVADGDAYALVQGAGAFGGAPLATTSGDTIRIDTGRARFNVRKRHFNGLDRVVRDGVQIVTSHDVGGVVVETDGIRYESAFDDSSEVTIEENGPVRATLCARGVLRSATQQKSLGYTARLQFDRGSSGCRVFLTLRNADAAFPHPRSFHAAWFEVPLHLAGPGTVHFGFKGDGFTGPVAADGAAHLFQGDNRFERGVRTDEVAPLLTSAVGLEVEINGTALNRLGSSSEAAPGWMRVDDGRTTVLAGMRDMAAWFPSGFDLQGGRLAVELFSRHNPRTNLVFAWGAHETREIALDFAPAGADAQAFHDHLQWPIFGRCAFSRYRDTGAFCGERRLVSVEEESRFFQDQGKSWRMPQVAAADLRLTRRYHFGTTGGGNQFDQDECLLLDFARSGAPGLFLQGRLGALWKADQAVLHSDDFDFGTRELGISNLNAEDPNTFHGRGAGNTFDDEHPHWVCMAHYYHMTGDEHVREAIADYGEWRRYRAGNPTHGARRGGALHHMRLWSRCFRDLALLWQMSGDKRYLDDVHVMAKALTTTLDDGHHIGRNLDRGYFYFGDPENPQRKIHLFFLTEMNSLAVYQAMAVLAPKDPAREALRDYLTGLAWFTLEEALVVPGARGYPYEYFANAPNLEAGKRGDQTGIVLVHGYEQTGDARFMDRARALAWRVAEYQHPLRASELATHACIYRWLHRAESGAVLLAPRALRNADDTWTLSWTVPVGARETIVRYGAKPLVDNLGFDPVRRAFRTDPTRAMNVWAATNLAGEPAPGRDGTIESWRTPALPHASWVFAVQVLTDRTPGGEDLRSDNNDAPSGTTVAPAPKSGSGPIRGTKRRGRTLR